MYSTRVKYKLPFNRYGLTRGALFYVRYASVSIIAATSLAALVLLILSRPAVFFCGLVVLYLAIRGANQSLWPYLSFLIRRKKTRQSSLVQLTVGSRPEQQLPNQQPTQGVRYAKQTKPSFGTDVIPGNVKRIFPNDLSFFDGHTLGAGGGKIKTVNKSLRKTVESSSKDALLDFIGSYNCKAFVPGEIPQDQESPNLDLKGQISAIKSIINDEALSSNQKELLIRCLLPECSIQRQSDTNLPQRALLTEQYRADL